MQLTNTTTISLGKPVTAPVLIPVIHDSTPNCINDPFMVNGKLYNVTCVSFGAPYGAVLVDDVDNADVSSIGSALGTHVLFPKGASIVFIQVVDRDSLKARVWRRGEGEAVFTPEAACVAVIVAIMLQKIMKHEADIVMGDHTFHVKWDMWSDNVYLTGPSDLVQA